MSKPKEAAMVLVVDDDPDTCEVIELSGTLDGYRVRVASCPDEAMEIVELETPAIIFLDYYGMGDGLQDFVARVRSRNAHIPIVLMTGANAPHQKARELGLKEYLAKPFGSEQLEAFLTRYRVLPEHVAKAHAAISLFL